MKSIMQEAASTLRLALMVKQHNIKEKSSWHETHQEHQDTLTYLSEGCRYLSSLAEL